MSKREQRSLVLGACLVVLVAWVVLSRRSSPPTASAPGVELARLPQRLLAPRSVLVLDAGAGSEVAAALDGGAARVVAVTLDPESAALASARSTRLEVRVGDSRRFLERTAERFDLVSLSLVERPRSPFVSTLEAFREVKRVLAPGGAFALAVPGSPPWLPARAYLTVSEAFSEQPRIYGRKGDASGATVFVAGRSRKLEGRSLGDGIEELSVPYYEETPLATDDWPFLDRDAHGILPGELAFLGVALGVAFAVAAALALARRRLALSLVMLGSGVTLVAARTVSELERHFGRGARVPALAGILLVGLLANELVLWRAARPSRVLGWLLAGTLVVAFVVRAEALGDLSPDGRACVLVLLLAAPSFLGAWVVATELACSPRAKPVLAGLLMGLLSGFVLAHASEVLGLRSLLAVALLVFAVGLTLARRSPGEVA